MLSIVGAASDRISRGTGRVVISVKRELSISGRPVQNYIISGKQRRVVVAADRPREKCDGTARFALKNAAIIAYSFEKM